LDWFRWLWARLHEDDDDLEEGPIAGAFKIGCLIVGLFAVLAMGLTALSR
jgi:hypothetical protein